MEIVLLVTIVGIFSIFYFLFANQYYIFKKSQLMETAFKELHTLPFPDYFESISEKEDEEENEEEVDFFTSYEEENFKFLITDEQYQPLYYTDSPRQENVGIKVQRRIKDRKSEFEKEGLADVELRDRKGEVRKISLSGVIYQKGKKYYIYISELTYIAEKNVAYAKNLLLFSIIAAVTIGSIFFYFMAEKITNPIIEIDQVANALAAKDFTVKVRENMPYLELERLAKSINSMSAQIQEYIEKLENYNRDLVKENEFKTEMEIMRKQFVNNVSHELKTPLAVISSQVEMLSYIRDEKEKKYYFNSIIEEVNEMSEMISSMLTIFSVEHGLEKMDLTSVNLSNIVKRLIERYDIMFHQKGVICETYLEENSFVLANEKYISQVVTNYLMNAYKHTKCGKCIKISITSHDNIVEAAVYNDGENIKEEEMQKIWNSFYQGTGKDIEVGQFRGTGLGLYIVKNIIKFHDGECGIRNKEQGVEFYFTLKELL